MSKKKQSINYLDLIPQRAETLRWHTDEATGLITLEVENTGVFNTIAQKVFHKPRTTQVHLDIGYIDHLYIIPGHGLSDFVGHNLGVAGGAAKNNRCFLHDGTLLFCFEISLC